jgi:hypothetical protein
MLFTYPSIYLTLHLAQFYTAFLGYYFVTFPLKICAYADDYTAA